jgi:hypothetical protein
VFDPKDPGLDYELAWPREVFRDEATALLRMSGDHWPSMVEWFLREAFASDVPADDWRDRNWAGSSDVLVGAAGTRFRLAPEVSRAKYLQALRDAADKCQERSAPRAYWPARHTVPSPAPLEDLSAEIRASWARCVQYFRDRGYFERVAPGDCCDNPAEDQDCVLSRESDRRLNITNLWPLQPGTWDEDTFYGLVEVVHDLVSRPRHRVFHDYGGDWHFSKFARAPACALYRYEVNRILARYGTGLELASKGEDLGRLVRQLDDARQDLMAAAFATPADPDRRTLEHAVALFRSRTAGREDRRSACIALVGLLEERRSVLKERLLSKDEGALFRIANEFGLRHRNARQRADYDESYLEWIFWIFLATYELTDRLAARADA